MKNNIICYHPIKGFITYNDLIMDLKRILENYKNLENLQFDSETIASLFSFSIDTSLEDIINSLQNK